MERKYASTLFVTQYFCELNWVFLNNFLINSDIVLNTILNLGRMCSGLNFRSRILKFRLRLQKPRSFEASVGYIVINFLHFPCDFYIVAWARISFFRELSFFDFLHSFYCTKSCQKWRKNIVEENSENDEEDNDENDEENYENYDYITDRSFEASRLL